MKPTTVKETCLGPCIWVLVPINVSLPRPRLFLLPCLHRLWLKQGYPYFLVCGGQQQSHSRSFFIKIFTGLSRSQYHLSSKDSPGPPLQPSSTPNLPNLWSQMHHNITCPQRHRSHRSHAPRQAGVHLILPSLRTTCTDGQQLFFSNLIHSTAIILSNNKKILIHGCLHVPDLPNPL